MHIGDKNGKEGKKEKKNFKRSHGRSSSLESFASCK